MKVRLMVATAALLSLVLAPIAWSEDLALIHTSGHGEVSVAPDRAWVSFGVQASAREVTDAQTEVDKVVGRVLDLTDGLGIKRARVKTAQLSVQADYEWLDKPRRRELLGYTVSRQITIDLRKLDSLGQLIHRALKLGVNQVSGPRFDHTRRAEFGREALAAATIDAKAQAEVMAKAAGVDLGPVWQMSAGHAAPQAMPQMQGRMMAMQEAQPDGAQSYEAGELLISSTVSASFRIR